MMIGHNTKHDVENVCLSQATVREILFLWRDNTKPKLVWRAPSLQPLINHCVSIHNEKVSHSELSTSVFMSVGDALHLPH